MSALVTATVRVKNPDKLQQYISQVPPTMAPHGGEMLGRGKVAKSLHGDVSYQIEAIFRFPSTEAVDAWFASAEYQAITKLRDEAADMTIVVLNSF